MKLQIRAVCVGRPRPLGIRNGQPVPSGIAKQIVSSEQISVGLTNLAGDEQADLRVHGGVDKAVYAYPSDHWAWWQSVHGLVCSPATFGENLTLIGADETQISIGDRFRWGSAELEVSQPRAPCFKLGLHTEREDVPQLMTISARCGWYFRVRVEGVAPAISGAHLERIHAEAGPTVRQCFVAALHPEIPQEERRRVASTERLSRDWRGAVERRLR
jgi:MOSC domain-containing protein YiiM